MILLCTGEQGEGRGISPFLFVWLVSRSLDAQRTPSFNVFFWVDCDEFRHCSTNFLLVDLCHCRCIPAFPTSSKPRSPFSLHEPLYTASIRRIFFPVPFVYGISQFSNITSFCLWNSYGRVLLQERLGSEDG